MTAELNIPIPEDFPERIAALFRSSKDAGWYFNPRTGELWWNKAFYRLAGISPHLPPPNLYEWAKRIHPDDRGNVMARITGARSIGISSWEDRCRLRGIDGSYRKMLDVALVLADESGAVSYLLGALIDAAPEQDTDPEPGNAALLAIRNKLLGRSLVH